MVRQVHRGHDHREHDDPRHVRLQRQKPEYLAQRRQHVQRAGVHDDIHSRVRAQGTGVRLRVRQKLVPQRQVELDRLRCRHHQPDVDPATVRQLLGLQDVPAAETTAESQLDAENEAVGHHAAVESDAARRNHVVFDVFLFDFRNHGRVVLCRQHPLPLQSHAVPGRRRLGCQSVRHAAVRLQNVTVQHRAGRADLLRLAGRGLRRVPQRDGVRRVSRHEDPRAELRTRVVRQRADIDTDDLPVHHDRRLDDDNVLLRGFVLAGADRHCVHTDDHRLLVLLAQPHDRCAVRQLLRK